MKLLIITALFVVTISCTNQSEIVEKHGAQQIEAIELIDIRVPEENRIIFNGITISETSLNSHLTGLQIDSTTRARVISTDNISFGLVTKIQKELVQTNIGNVKFMMLEDDAFQQFHQDTVLIDVLNNGKIRLDGHLIHPADLDIALQENDFINKNFKISIADNATYGSVMDVAQTLSFQNVVFTDASDDEYVKTRN